VKPTRLRAAEAAVRTFLDRVPKRLRVGLIAFAGDPEVASPPTTDRGTVRDALNTLQWFPRYGGTAIGDALAAAVELGRQAATRSGGDLAAVTTAAESSTHGLVSILMLSDGAQTRGNLEPLEGAQRAKTAGIPVYTVALGTPNGRLRFDRAFGGGFGGPNGGFGNGGGGFGNGGGGFGGRSVPVPPDPQTLRAIADTTGGKFFAARSAESLTSAYKKLGSSLGRKPGHTEITYVFLLIAAGLLLGAVVLSAVWSPRVP
jgi:Ca-activated chloride channel family protein